VLELIIVVYIIAQTTIISPNTARFSAALY